MNNSQLSYARFQQRQMQEREEKLLKLYENQQQRAFEKVGRGSAGSNTSSTSGGSTCGGKVRQMFDERRQKAGIDKSYPLEPLKARTNNRVGGKNNSTTTSRTVIKSTVQKSVSSVRNGKAVASKREVVQNIYNNNDGDESYEEHRYQDDNTDMFNSKSHRDIIDMMNDHNLKDDLDNEVLPQIGFDEVDKPRVAEGILTIVTRTLALAMQTLVVVLLKLAMLAKSGATNVKVKSPSQNGVVRRSVDTRPATKSNGATTTRREQPCPKETGKGITSKNCFLTLAIS
ncbi:hypothetical protein NQ318_018602 [Aromia moschata]|uniref:Uncharacterized protein n=1 Tax=Aromia moschata TaxID=1265417 RepID=A0AAV8ZII3_9CUCU|nr:hypothetical protein NQ318_018602 [Aromia moschata]